MEIVVLGPAVELPVDQADAVGHFGRRFILDHECRPGVAEPDAVGCRLEEPDSIEIDRHGIEPVGHPALHAPHCRPRCAPAPTRLRWRTISV